MVQANRIALGRAMGPIGSMGPEIGVPRNGVGAIRL